MSVDVRDSSTRGVSRVDRKPAGPACHPRHGHAAHERFQRPLMQAPRAGMQFDEAAGFALRESVQSCWGAHTGAPARCQCASFCRKLAAVSRYASRLAFFLKPCPSSFASRYHTSPPAARTLHTSCSDSETGMRGSLDPATTSSGFLMRLALVSGEMRSRNTRM